MENSRPSQILYTTLLTLFLLTLTSFAQRYSYNNINQIQSDAEDRYLSHSGDVQRYYESAEIENDQTINSNIVIIEGNLDIYGVVNGDILAVFGNVEIHEGACIYGNITSIDGVIYLHNEGSVSGVMLEKTKKHLRKDRIRNRKNDRHYRKYFRGNRNSYTGTLRLDDTDDFLMRYNRVQGLFLGLNAPKELHSNRNHFDIHGFVGYGFKSNKVRYQAGLTRWFTSPYKYRTEFGAEYHDLTDSKDLWRLGHTENSLAAFFFKTDYHDYYRRNGYSIHLTQNISPYIQAKAEYRSDDYESLSQNTNWSLFRGDEKFWSNPSLGDDEGTMRSFYGALILDTRDRLQNTRRGVFAKVSGEISTPELDSDFDFEQYIADARVYVPVGWGETFMIRTIVGTSLGDLPFQKNYELGGISTLRGYAYKQFSGNRMFLTNLEYRFSSNLFGDFLGLDNLTLILFTDYGSVWTGNEDNVFDSFNPLRLDNLNNNIGIGFADADGDFRLDFAKRTDSGDNALLVTLRFKQPF